MKTKTKALIGAGLALFILVSALIVVIIFAASNSKTAEIENSLPLNAVLTTEQAQADLKFMYDAVRKNHPCYLDSSGLDKVFDGAYEDAKNNLSSLELITVRDLWEIGAEMYCSIEDGHTLINFYNSKQISDSEKLSGGKIISVDGIPREELLFRFRKVFPCEPQVDFYVDYMLDEALRFESWNELIEIDTSDGIIVEIQTENGIETAQLIFAYPDLSMVVDTGEDGESFYSYELYEEQSAAVFILDECAVTDGYKNALEEFFKGVSENNISRIAIDLRRNGGGNSQVINEFMKYIDVDSYYVFGGVSARYGDMLVENEAYLEKNKQSKYAFSGELYALTSNYTFSSAMDFAVAISDNGIGKVIGEIPGNMPTCYGDKLTFQAPNSKLLCGVSYKKFYRADRTKDNLPLIPDFEIDAEQALDTFLNINN